MKPVPNVLYQEENKALSRLGEYSVSILRYPSKMAPKGHVFHYELTDDVHVNLYISDGDVDKNYQVTLPVKKQNPRAYEEKPFSLDPRVSVRILGFATGRASENASILIPALAGSTDLGIPLDLGDRLAFLYGDTFSGNDCNDGIWNSNFIALANKTNEGIPSFCGVVHDGNGYIKPIAQGKHHRDLEANLDISLGKEVTKIPTGGCVVGGYVYIYMMQVRHWGKPGEWFVTENQLYRAPMEHLDHFEPMKDAIFPESQYPNLGQIAPFDYPLEKSHIYMAAIPGGRFGSAVLLRVRKEDIEHANRYELLIGPGQWDKAINHPHPDYFILGGPISEPSIAYNPYWKTFLFSSIWEGTISFFQSQDPVNTPFKNPIPILGHKELPSFYGGFLHPSLFRENGKRILMQVSQWSPIYNTSWVEVTLKGDKNDE